MLSDGYPEQRTTDDYGVRDGTGSAEHRGVPHADDPSASSDLHSHDSESLPHDRSDLTRNDETENEQRGTQHAGRRWWLLPGISAFLLTGLTIAGIYLVTKKPSTVDQLVILTVPSGAEIKLDSKDYGHSPVKLEQLRIGTYQLTITKEGFEPIEQSLTVAESGPVEFKLKPVLPSETGNMPAEEMVKQFQQQAEEALTQGNYGLIYEGSAINYADLIQRL